MQTRADIFAHVEQTYGVLPDYPWARTPNNAILRHPNGNKWFAAVLDVPANRLGLPSSEVVDVLNLKCDPILMGSLLHQDGIYPGYHMNRDHWISVLLSADVAPETVQDLIALSYELTMKKPKKARKKADADPA